MLVLSRKQGEQLLIGDNIVLTINRISSNRVAIGIDAPKDIRIVRGELEVKEFEVREVETTCGEAQVSENASEYEINKQNFVAPGSSPMTIPMEESRVSVASNPSR